MELDFSNLGPQDLNSYEETFFKLAQKVFSHLNVNDNYLIDVAIVDNKSIQEINRDYRNKDCPTDVISFAFLDDKKEIFNTDCPNSLGQIIISYERANEQASAYKHTLMREMSFLFVHGLLHLLGYDHMKKCDELIMFSIQNEILGGFRMEKEELVAKAIEARELAYVPYSHFKVGAVILTKDGRLFLGANIENSSYPCCMCAERNAIFNAYLHGVKKDDIAALALSADTDGPCSPCGACRQVLSELMPSNAPIFMSNLKGTIKETTIKELLPYAFSEDDLK